MRRLWEKFGEMSSDCYLEDIVGPKTLNIWRETYAVLKQALLWERKNNPEFPMEYDEIDCALDDMYGSYYNITEWVMDFFDELELNDAWEEVIDKATEIMNLFAWEEIKADEFKVRIARALVEQEKTKEAIAYCEKWYGEDENDIAAATALVYCFMEIQDFVRAESIVEKFLYYKTVEIAFDAGNPSSVHYETVQKTSDMELIVDEKDIIECDDVNYILFLAAHTLYQIQEKYEKADAIGRKIEEYDEKIMELAKMGEEFSFEEWGEELPF